MALKIYMRIIPMVLLMFLFRPVSADDPGITKVRLIQETDSSYTFELDISRQLLWTIKAPVLPEGFRITNPEYEDQSGWITMKARITSSGESFSPEDEI